MTTTYAALVTPENINDIIADAAKWKLNVDYLQDSVDEAVEYDTQIYAILSINYDLRYATFTEMWVDDFENTWQFTGATHGPHFRVVTLK
jgi:hypothetical protein